jgi:hypothetical protein
MARFPVGQSGDCFVEPPGGWKSFAATTWEQQSAYFPNCVHSPLVDIDGAFGAILKASESERKGSIDQRLTKPIVRFYIEETSVSRDLRRYLPILEDKSLQGYADRMRRVLAGRDFTLVVNDSQAYDFELWRRMGAFVSGLYSYIGLPVFAEAILYLSKAQTTAIGLHKDPVSNFLFQLAGTKKFRMWPKEIVESKPHLVRTSDFESISSEAITVEVKPGDLLYMPSDYFHMAEAGDDISVHLSITISTGEEAGRLHAVRVFTKTLRSRMSAIPFSATVKIDPTSLNGSDLKLPDSYKALLETCADLGDYVQRTMVEEFMRLSTSFGCQSVPALSRAPDKLLHDDSIELNSQSAVAHHLFDDKMYIASNGHGFSCTAHPLAVELVKHLTEAQSHRVDSLMSTYSGLGIIGGIEAELRQEDVEKLLEGLHRIRAIRKTNVMA